MPQQDYTRVTVLLPVPNTPDQFLALNDVLTDLIRLCGGVTTSVFRPPVFQGQWFNLSTQQVEADNLIMIIADVHVPSTTSDLAAYLDQLKLDCQQQFDQEIVWMTIEDLRRITTDDYVH